MIRDGRNGTFPEALDYDLVIVGAGPAGITMALELEATGLRIALLESGGEDYDDATQDLYDGRITGLDRTDLLTSRLRFLGGTSNHWGGHCLPLDPIDFERGPLNGMSGWPFPRAALTDAYRRAHVYCDLGDFDYDPATSIGTGPDDFLLTDSGTVDTAVIRQSPPTRFGPKNAKALKRSETIDLWLWTNVTDIEITADGEARSVDTRTLTGVPRRFAARQLVLASGGIETTRLLMVNNRRNGQSFGDAGGLLGRCFMDHVEGGAAFLWLDRPTPQKAYWRDDIAGPDGVTRSFVWRISEDVLRRDGLANAQFYLIPFANPEARAREREANRGWRGLKDMAKWVLGRSEYDFSFSDSYCQAVTHADAVALDALGLIDRSETATRLLLRYEAEQQPERGSYVGLIDDLDALGMPRSHLHWSPGAADRDSIIAAARLIGIEAGAADLGRLELEDHFDQPYWDANTAWHHLGSTRMAASPTSGVVDPDCRVHGTQNLFIASGSVMPSIGRANPTLTIVALSIRLADHLKALNAT